MTWTAFAILAMFYIFLSGFNFGLVYGYLTVVTRVSQFAFLFPNKGRFPEKKTAVLLDFVQITSPLPPIWKSSLPVSWDPPSVTKNHHFQSFGTPL